MKNKIRMFAFWSVLVLVGFLLFLILKPLNYDVPVYKAGADTRYWTLPTGSKNRIHSDQRTGSREQTP
ncbi:MAG: hypothetical protein IPF68_06450 [Bacteroidales bacterium]|nr:hypothetical protein [Bacteroidales bacterium]